MGGLTLPGGITIPESEFVWRYSTPGGPGGQHANRSASRADLVFDLASSSSIPPDLRVRMLANLGSAAPDGVVTVTEGASRSQWRNRARARARLTRLLIGAMAVPESRRPTRPSAAARRRRLEAKRRRSETKRLRQPPEAE